MEKQTSLNLDSQESIDIMTREEFGYARAALHTQRSFRSQ